VFASANTALPASLYAAGLVDRPVPFATNRLVLAVPAHGARVDSLADLGRPGVRIAVGAPSVPVGAYTRKVITRLGAEGRVIAAHARTSEPSVDGIVGKLTTGAVDAGFLYITDVAASHGALRAISCRRPRSPPSCTPWP
jgi:molybdate transport system substrate-binding protein